MSREADLDHARQYYELLYLTADVRTHSRTFVIILGKYVPSTLTLNNSEVEIVDSFKFLGIHITSNLSWSVHARYMCKKAQQRLDFLRCLKKFHMKPEILVNFYRSIIESILTGSITVWFANMTYDDRNSLSRVIFTAR